MLSLRGIVVDNDLGRWTDAARLTMQDNTEQCNALEYMLQHSEKCGDSFRTNDWNQQGSGWGVVKHQPSNTTHYNAIQIDTVQFEAKRSKPN